MALIHSKQLNPKLTGSFILSGSQQDFLGTNQLSFTGPSKFVGSITGSVNSDVSMSYNSTGSFGRLEIVGDSNLSGDVTIGGNINIGDSNTDSLKISADLSSSLIPDADSTYDLGSSTKFWKDGYIDTLTATGNISGSSVTTASFGKIKLNDDTHLNAGTFAISGSSVSTASFGLVKVHAIGGNSPITFTDTIIENQNLEVVGHITASGNISNVSTTHVTASGNVDVGGDLNVSQYIKHKDDSNTYLNFTDDRLRFNIGGISYLDFNDSTAAPHDITFNDGANNVDVTIKGSSNNPLFKTDASAGRIGTNGIGTPLAGLHLGDTLLVNSHITASANISASGNLDVGGKIYSIGDIETQGDIIAQNFIVSSSVTYMTQSFSSGSTIFGDSNDDTHQMTGSLLNKGSITTTGTLTATGNIITQGSINASQGQIFGSAISDKHEFTGSVVVTGSLNTESGRIFEQGTSVIDHATAMAIVFGG